jgi:hypothetical protein
MTQEEYIAILFEDCGYATTARRKDWLLKRFGKGYPDELSTGERSHAITLLKAEKDAGMELDWDPETSWNRDRKHYR